jgi:hypothetical protein
VDAWPAAEKILGLTEYEADVLFSGSNSLEDLQKYVATLTDDNYKRDSLGRNSEEEYEDCPCCRDYLEDDEEEAEEEA